MTFHPGISVKVALERVLTKQWLLPAIQREFVWDQDQILTLVDSLMRGYPIGSFLFWNVKPESVSLYQYFDFITEFHERDASFANKAAVPVGQGIIGVLDGQQRLTALNIAFYGSYTQKKKFAWGNKFDSFVKKNVYLNLMDSPKHEELGHMYELKFLSEKDSHLSTEDASKWFKVSDVLHLQDGGPAILSELETRGLDVKAAYPRLSALYSAVVDRASVSWYEEESQDADKVLDIFVRVNSGGTTLSNSDLLLSMATNQWEHLDARDEVRKLVQEVNNFGFNFSKDTILKSSLMISGLPIEFKISSFTRENMLKVEKDWELTKSSLFAAARLLKSFGYSAQNLRAQSAVMPISYYLSKREDRNNYVDSGTTNADKLALKSWFAQVLLKQGIWGSGLDTLLRSIRSAIDSSDAKQFPEGSIRDAMAVAGKALTFDDAEIEEVLNYRYGSQQAFAILTLLYPGLDLSQEFHEDHIFPKSKFTQAALKKIGFEADKAESFSQLVDTLPNLQLLKGLVNIEKQAKMPQAWIDAYFEGDEPKKNTYLLDNDLVGSKLENEHDFEAYYVERKSRMLNRLQKLLGL